MEIADVDRAAIRSIISSQLEAFQRDDADAAFALAIPEIQAQFGTVDNFMRMVKAHYQPVYRPRSVLFGDITTVHELPTQQIMLLSDDGLVKALYLMQKQSNNNWRIAGCYLVPVEKDIV